MGGRRGDSGEEETREKGDEGKEEQRKAAVGQSGRRAQRKAAALARRVCT